MSNVEHWQSSVERAKSHLGPLGPEDEIVILKLEPQLGSRCCCFHCWPNTWASVTQSLETHGVMKDEGDLLVTTNGGSFVLECHESGPEIVIAALNLVPPIIGLVMLFLKGQQEERKASRFKLTSRRIVRGEVEEEMQVEIDLPLSPETAKMIETEVTKTLRKDARLPGEKK